MVKICENCPCPRVQCKRHGNCEECRKHHRKLKNPPYCEQKRKSEGKKN